MGKTAIQTAAVPSPVRVLRDSLKLTQEEFAKRVGRSRSTVADAEQMRAEKPPMVFFKRLLRLGLIASVNEFAHRYRVARAGLDGSWLTSSPAPVLPPTATPSHPLQQFLDFNGLNVADLCHRLGPKHRKVIEDILDRKASVPVASAFFQSLRWALPMEWANANLGDNADLMYQSVVVHFKDRDDRGWRDFPTYMEASLGRGNDE